MRFSVNWTAWLRGPTVEDEAGGRPKVLQEERAGSCSVEDAENTAHATAVAIESMDDELAMWIAERKALGQSWRLGGVVMSAYPVPEDGTQPNGETFKLEAEKA